MQSLDCMLIFAIHCSIFFASFVVQRLVSCFNVVFITFLIKNTVHMTTIVCAPCFICCPMWQPSYALRFCPVLLSEAVLRLGGVFSASFAFMHDITIAHKTRTKRTLLIFYNIFLILLSGIVALIF